MYLEIAMLVKMMDVLHHGVVVGVVTLRKFEFSSLHDCKLHSQVVNTN